MKLFFSLLLVPLIGNTMENRLNYYLLAPGADIIATTKFDKFYKERKAELEPEFSNACETNFEKQMTRAISKGKLNLVIKFCNEKEKDCSHYFSNWNGSRQVKVANSYNPIEACLQAMQIAKNLGCGQEYRIAESAMLMALVLDYIPDTAEITKSQIHRAWKLNPHVSRMMALSRKHPERAEEIIEKHKELIREVFTRKLTRNPLSRSRK
ncbi:MAG: hypothetical protein AMXMBFR12_08860 [Candidatus Babeliales bacterium]